MLLFVLTVMAWIPTLLAQQPAGEVSIKDQILNFNPIRTWNKLKTHEQLMVAGTGVTSGYLIAQWKARRDLEACLRRVGEWGMISESDVLECCDVWPPALGARTCQHTGRKIALWLNQNTERRTSQREDRQQSGQSGGFKSVQSEDTIGASQEFPVRPPLKGGWDMFARAVKKSQAGSSPLVGIKAMLKPQGVGAALLRA